MEAHLSASSRLRQRLTDERERRGLSQRAIARLFAPHGLIIHPSTVAKIETGDRAVSTDELDVYATIFATSMDALTGRTGGDLAWAAAALTSNAQRMAGDIAAMRARLRSENEDVRVAIGGAVGESTRNLLEHISIAAGALIGAQNALNALASQYPIPN